MALFSIEYIYIYISKSCIIVPSQEWAIKKEDTCYNEIGLRVQCITITRVLIVNTTMRIYMTIRMFLLSILHISMISELEMTIFVIHNALPTSTI